MALAFFLFIIGLIARCINLWNGLCATLLCEYKIGIFGLAYKFFWQR